MNFFQKCPLSTLPNASLSASWMLRNFMMAGSMGVLTTTALAQAVDYSATLNSNLSNQPAWQSSIWTFDSQPPGDPLPTYPNNSDAAHYNVIVPTHESISLTDDVTINKLTINNGLTFQNGSAHSLTVLGNFELKADKLITMSEVNVSLAGNSVFTGQASLQNGSTLENLGNLSAGPNSAATHLAITLDHANDYDFINATGATATFGRVGGVTFQNFRFLNTGSIDIQGAGIFEVGSSYSQTAGITRITDGNTLKTNSFNFSGGSIFASGNALQGNLSLANTTLEIGADADQAAILTMSGNIASSMAGSRFNFDLGGAATVGVDYDQLILPGGNFDQVFLDIGFINDFQNSITNTDLFTIITGNNLNGTFANQVGNTLSVPGVGSFLITQSNNSVVLSGFSPIPEPSAMILAASGLLGFALIRRRRS